MGAGLASDSGDASGRMLLGRSSVDRVGIGIIGCGNISAAYLKAARAFPILDVRAVADLNPAAAEARGAEFGVPATTVDGAPRRSERSRSWSTSPCRSPMSRSASRRSPPASTSTPRSRSPSTPPRRGRSSMRRRRKGLRVGCAPDTFLGGAHQTCRKLIDDGAIGQPLAGTAFFMCPGHERWHPSPAFYYLRGGGPVLDMAPYYVTDLVNLLGPVARVAGDHRRAPARHERSPASRLRVRRSRSRSRPMPRRRWNSSPGRW